ncbi:hypothetical protein SAMN05216213_107261 [Ectopseudomonas guguanensis]|uniref:Uncharacterized protein n=1 Tax=Ectopseudomonas guguanensis TaxID=1198456 RepID=A0A1H0WQF9_9GAMM|nr:hypothetical protein SAMN05216213_107261 [Pseudomonas guguanensis]
MRSGLTLTGLLLTQRGAAGSYSFIPRLMISFMISEVPAKIR